MRYLVRSAVSVMLVASACASSQHGASKARSDPNLITREDIVRTGARDAFEALRLAHTNISLSEGRGQMTMARPVSATSRGRSSLVLNPQMLLVVDGASRLDVSSLHEIPAENVEWIRVMTAMEATPLYGTEGGNGAIVVRTRIPNEGGG